MRKILVLLFFTVFSNLAYCAHLVILSPQGEVWGPGPQVISWESGPEIKKVSLAYIVSDGPIEVHKIAQGIEAGKQSYTWFVPRKHLLYHVILKGYDENGKLLKKAYSLPSEIAWDVSNKARQMSYEGKKVIEIKLSERPQKLRVYEKGVLIYESLISTRVKTPIGIYTVTGKGMPYCLRLGNGVYDIHGPPYKTKGKFFHTPWGYPFSGGCIRVFWQPKNPKFANKAKELYDLIPKGTQVVIEK